MVADDDLDVQACLPGVLGHRLAYAGDRTRATIVTVSARLIVQNTDSDCWLPLLGESRVAAVKGRACRSEYRMSGQYFVTPPADVSAGRQRPLVLISTQERQPGS
jgi:hypothetical protein